VRIPEVGADVGKLAGSLAAKILNGAVLVAKLPKELGSDTLQHQILSVMHGALGQEAA
jgi:hypothetical protein